MKESKSESRYIPLKVFVVNHTDAGGEKVAQIGITLEAADPRQQKILNTLFL